MKVHASLACMPGLCPVTAMRHLSEVGIREPLFGDVSIDHIQLVPQSQGRLDDQVVELLLRAWPQVRFRLHANTRVLQRHRLANLSNFLEHREYFLEAARISSKLKAPAYSAHSGARQDASFEQLISNTLACQDLFGCPVAIEGQYPTRRGSELLMSTWAEYAQLLDVDIYYAIDLSHLNILARHDGHAPEAMVQELLSNERCIEVHLSANDGQGDQHRVCGQHTWWSSALPYINSNCVVFTEGNHRHFQGNSL